MGKTSRILGFALSSQDLADMLIKEFGFPEDIVITRFERPLNQDAWMVNLYSPQFPEHSDLDLLPTMRYKKGYNWKEFPNA
ncbi:MAG: hypothetical protein KGL39_58655 [Patescibacteria group bacterium]|nr:hypothetical protein [Patescibacteria group bacterium]